MQPVIRFFFVFLFGSSIFAVSPEEAHDIAIEAYIYGYPLVTMEMTRRVMTNAETAGATKAPMGQFAHMKKYPLASFHDVTAPNADTLYSSAWVDLSKEPYVLCLPDTTARYFLMPVISAWTDVIADPGTRTTGAKPQTLLLTGPSWEGKIPSGMKQIKSPTSVAWLIGRTYCSGTAEDYEAVAKIQQGYTLTPLSAWGKPYVPPKGIFNTKIDMQMPVREQVNRLDGQAFFRLLAALLQNNPPAAQDAPIIEKMAKIGLTPGQSFEIGHLETAVAKAVMAAPSAAWKKIASYESSTSVNGWHISYHLGSYGTNYLLRAHTAAFGLGANLPQDAIYPYTKVDSGQDRYILHFNKGDIPPVQGFWSLTMYDDNYFFAPNPLHRYTVSPRDALKYNSDGSLDLYIQHASPGKLKEGNWLPAPEGSFILMLRLYWPEERALDGSWEPPAVKKG